MIVSSLISIPYYAVTPGTAQSVERLIALPSADRHEHKGSFLLVDVELIALRAIEWPYYKLDPNVDIVPSGSLLGPETAAQYNTEGVIDMAMAEQAAKVVALRETGHLVSVRPAGALIYAVEQGTPAAQDLQVGEVVTALDGKAVTDAPGLGRLISVHRPGDVVTVVDHVFQSGKSSSAKVRLGTWRIKGKGKTATVFCAPFGRDTALPILHRSPDTGQQVSVAPCVGALDVRTNYAIGKLPFPVNLNSEGIVGPSAGLAFTLGLMQQLDPFDLTGGHKVAATGTMSVTGQVGDVGGVAQKTIAVRNAGARIFLVPTQEYKVALAHAGNKLKVYAVSSIAQAIKVLQSYGGKLPPRPSNS
ncbi:MAG: S16 family serine protease [Acidimicrobiales bacterium]